MPFGLTIGTERANTLQVRENAQFSTRPLRLTTPPPQTAIQYELANRGWGTEPDITMAEYITIMLINGKSEDQINSELMDRASQPLFYSSRLLIISSSWFVVIGPDYGMRFAPKSLPVFTNHSIQTRALASGYLPRQRKVLQKRSLPPPLPLPCNPSRKMPSQIVVNNLPRTQMTGHRNVGKSVNRDHITLL
jgi:hypothetical protein